MWSSGVEASQTTDVAPPMYDCALVPSRGARGDRSSLLHYRLQAALRHGACVWVGGSSHCGLYRALANVNLVCLALDYAITFLFTLCGQVMAHPGAQQPAAASVRICLCIAPACLPLS
jgi:hypothetical protein